MTTPKTGNISLNKVRSDLGLSPGSLIDRAVCNRAGFSASAKPSLEDHRGCAFAPQALITGNLNETMTRRDAGYQGSYPSPSGQWYVTSSDTGDGVTVQCATAAGGYDPSYGDQDASVEFRQGYYMPVSGNFQLSLRAELQQDTQYNSMRYEVALYGFDQGYLQGNLKTNVSEASNFDRDFTEGFSNDPSYPYVVLVLRIIGTGGDAFNTRVATFKNVKVRYQ